MRDHYLENIAVSIWYFESVCTITEGHVTRNRPSSIEHLYLTYNKVIYEENLNSMKYYMKDILQYKIHN